MRYLTGVKTQKMYSKIGLGTWQFGSRAWQYGPEYETRESVAIVDRALALGVTVFDTAEVYGFGRSERVLGKALRQGLQSSNLTRDDIVLASKVFPFFPVSPVVQQRAVASCSRLGLGPIDLYQVHQANPLVRDGATMRGMRILRNAGIIRDVGVSNYSLARWRAADAALGSPVIANQVEYSLLNRKAEKELLRFAEGEGRIIIAYRPLGLGALCGDYDSRPLPTNGYRNVNPYFLPENLRRLRPLIELLREIADIHQSTPSQVALAWVIHHPSVVAIPGASSVSQAVSNISAAQLQLTGEQYDALSTASDRLHLIKGSKALIEMLRANHDSLGRSSCDVM